MVGRLPIIPHKDTTHTHIQIHTHTYKYTHTHTTPELNTKKHACINIHRKIHLHTNVPTHTNTCLLSDKYHSERYESPYPPSHGFNSTTNVLRREWLGIK